MYHMRAGRLSDRPPKRQTRTFANFQSAVIDRVLHWNEHLLDALHSVCDDLCVAMEQSPQLAHACGTIDKQVLVADLWAVVRVLPQIARDLLG